MRIQEPTGDNVSYNYDLRFINKISEKLSLEGLHISDECMDISNVSIDDLSLNLLSHQVSCRVAFEYFEELKATSLNSFQECLHVNVNPFYTALHLASRYSWDECVDFLLNEGANINKKDIYGNSALLIAVSCNFTSTSKLLISRNAEITAADKHNRTPLHLAALHGNETLCGILLKQPLVKVNAKDNTQKTPLHLAVVGGNKKVTQLLVDHGADIKESDIGGQSAIHFAASEGATDLIVILVKGVLRDTEVSEQENIQRAFINEMTEEMDTPLHIAVKNGFLETAKMLVALGCDVNATNDRKQTPLHLVASTTFISIARFLLSNNANINAKDHKHMNALHRACLSGSLEMVKLLCSKKVVLDSRDRTGNTPLMLAVKHGSYKIVEHLLSNHAKIDVKDNEMRNLLHQAILENHYTTLKMLLEKGATKVINCADLKKKTPLHYAACGSSVKFIDLLLGYGADAEARDHKRKTPLHSAAKYDHVACVKSLIKTIGSVDDIGHVDIHGKYCLHVAAKHGCHEVWRHLISIRVDPCLTDSSQWTPLHYVANKGDHRTMDLILSSRNIIIDALNNEYLSPLHMACRANSPECVTLLLDKGADVTLRNYSNDTCLDEAARKRRTDVCEAIINHPSTISIMKDDGKFICSIEKLIKYAPHIAKQVLDKCEESIVDSNGNRKLVGYYFGIFDKIPDERNGDSYFAPTLMLKYKCYDLLTHPVTVQLIMQKWSKMGRIISFIWFLLTILFTSFMTAIVTTHKPDNQVKTFNSVAAAIILLIVCLNVFRQLMMAIHLGFQYFKYFRNYVQFLFYILTLVFVFPIILKAAGKDLKIDVEIQLQFGAISVLLAWTNLLFHFKHFYYGLYVEMLTEVLKSWIKVLLIFTTVIIAFALSFHLLLSSQKPFRSTGRSLVKTLVWMIGEMGFDNIFSKKLGDKEMLPFKDITVFIFCVFLLLMTLTFLNLLVGLAVGDIESVRKTAFLRLLKEKVYALEALRNSYPVFIQKRCHTNFYQIESGKNIFRRLFDRIGNLMVGNLHKNYMAEKRQRQQTMNKLQAWLLVERFKNKSSSGTGEKRRNAILGP